MTFYCAKHSFFLTNITLDVKIYRVQWSELKLVPFDVCQSFTAGSYSHNLNFFLALLNVNKQFISNNFFFHCFTNCILYYLNPKGKECVLASEIEVQRRLGNAYSLIRAKGPTSTPGRTTLDDIHVDGDRSLVSVMTMIFPSPDWFLGISNVDLCNPMTGEWRDSLSRDLLPYDAGTEDGSSFESPDSPSNPRKKITLIGKDDDTNFKSNSSIPRLGTFTFTKKPTKKCKGKAYYSLKFEAEWSNMTHPSPVFPNNSMFSPLIGASHNIYYEMWRRGKMASPGVQLVAETGKQISISSGNYSISFQYDYCVLLLCCPRLSWVFFN